MLSEILSKRDLLATLVEKDFKSRYKAKALGRLWSVADPLVMVVIYTIVFAHILQVAERFYPIFLLLGLTPWRFFTNSANGAAAAVSDNTQLVKRVAFPRVMLPLAVVFSHARHFFIELSLVVALFLYFPEAFIPTLQLLWLPVIFAVQLTFTVGVALMVSALNVRYRDTQYVLNSVVLVLTWLTPTFYSFNVVPEALAHLLMWNPMVGVVEGYRSVLLHGSRPSFTLMGSAGISALVMLVVGAILFRKYEHVFADYL
ncbi:MAG TPA: ABC transporter permease [Myxococcales bacterium]|jgi:ABC-2 type transport system permease protein